MKMKSNKELVKQLTEEVFLMGRVEQIDRLVSESFVDHDPFPGLQGRNGMKELASQVVSAFSDRTMVEDIYLDCEQDRVVQVWSMKAKHTGEFLGLKASNKLITTRGIEVFRIAERKISERWGAIDLTNFFEMARPSRTTAARSSKVPSRLGA